MKSSISQKIDFVFTNSLLKINYTDTGIIKRGSGAHTYWIN